MIADPQVTIEKLAGETGFVLENGAGSIGGNVAAEVPFSCMPIGGDIPKNRAMMSVNAAVFRLYG